MGIRVTKVLGYGLTDVKTRKWKIADGRINTKSPLLNWDSPVKLDDYIDWLEAKYDENKIEGGFNIDRWYVKESREEGFKWHDKTGVATPNELVHHGTEYMEKNILLVRPLFCNDWERYDNIIDYIEENHKYRDTDTGAVNWYREIPEGIYPWSGSFMHAKTGEPIKNGIDLWRYLTWPSFKNLVILDDIAESYGFVDEADIRENFVATVPEAVKDLCEWGKLFKDPDAWKQLRPMIYTYWS